MVEEVIGEAAGVTAVDGGLLLAATTCAYVGLVK